MVGFGSYTSGSVNQSGRVAYTLDGGVTWETAAFDGVDDDPETADCDEYTFYTNLNTVALLQPGVRSYNGGGDDWRLEFFVSSRNTSAPSCALARVLVEPSGGSVSASWTWYPLDRDTGICPIDGRNLTGVATSPWGEDAFIWGSYTSWPLSGSRSGGVCAVDVDDPTDAAGARKEVIDPQDWRFSIGAVEPHPYVSDLLAVAPLLDAISWQKCHQDGDGDCPDAPRVLLVDHDAAGWTVNQVASMAPSSAGNALAWTDLQDAALIYGTAGGGAWRGEVLWQ